MRITLVTRNQAVRMIADALGYTTRQINVWNQKSGFLEEFSQYQVDGVYHPMYSTEEIDAYIARNKNQGENERAESQ